jgi:TerC family integral membrane protein
MAMMLTRSALTTTPPTTTTTTTTRRTTTTCCARRPVNQRTLGWARRNETLFKATTEKKISLLATSSSSTTRTKASSSDEGAMTKNTEGDEDEKSTDVAVVAAVLGAACAFGAFIGATQGADKASEYFAGYLLEQSLSVDNLFVFVLVFEYFKVPQERQTRVLNYGIFGALLMRAVMVLAGVQVVENFKPTLLVFAGILIFSSYKLLSEGDEDEEEDMSDNAIVKFCSKFIEVSEDYDGDNFFTVQNGVKIATPLLLVLAVIEVSDVVFAVDSIPAVFGVTTDPFIVYTSNLFAIMSLRQLYGLISKAVGELKYLQTAVALVLGFIGVKMCVEFAGVDIPTEASLAVVATMLGGGVGASVLLPNDEDEGGEKDGAA